MTIQDYYADLDRRGRAAWARAVNAYNASKPSGRLVFVRFADCQGTQDVLVVQDVRAGLYALVSVGGEGIEAVNFRFADYLRHGECIGHIGTYRLAALPGWAREAVLGGDA